MDVCVLLVCAASEFNAGWHVVIAGCSLLLIFIPCPPPPPLIPLSRTQINFTVAIDFTASNGE